MFASGIALSSDSLLVVRERSIHCSADMDLPGRIRFMRAGRTIARGRAALREAWPLLSADARAFVAGKPKEPVAAIASDWSNASVEQIEASQPEVLRRLGPSRLAFRSAGDEIGFRSESEKLRDAGFVGFSVNKPAATAGDAVESADAVIASDAVAVAPLAPTLTPDWGSAEVERRWLLNGPLVRVSRLRSGQVSAICNEFGPVFTLSFTARDGRPQELAHLRREQAEQAVEAIEADGGVLLSCVEENRWHRRPLPAAVQNRARTRFEEWERSLPPKAERLAAGKRLRALAGRPTPYHLRHDLVAEASLRLSEDLRGMEDEAMPDSPTVAEFFPHYAR